EKFKLAAKLTLAHVAVMLSTLAILGTGVQITHIVLATVVAAVAGSLLGAWPSRRIVHRMDRALKVSRVWLRGNLSLRIADPVTDDLGLLAEQLDLMAEHLERGEQDLGELRERNMRLTDQVRALAVVEERNRLARELHDSVKQHLFSLAMTASAIRTRFDALPDVPKDLAEMVQEIETSAQRETTRLLRGPAPQPSARAGIGSGAQRLHCAVRRAGARLDLFGGAGQRQALAPVRGQSPLPRGPGGAAQRGPARPGHPRRRASPLLTDADDTDRPRQ
ncbi:MAG: histidine kinase, partial [Anaerolineae bacterium]